jgi:dTDP-4-dehydrorhamnose 3,5-epimerase
MHTIWQQVEPVTRGSGQIAGLPGVVLEAAPVYRDERGSLLELYRDDEIPAGFVPVMACCSWTLPGVSRGPHEHVAQDDYFTFAGPSDFLVALWDARPGASGATRGWWLKLGECVPARLYIPHGVVHGYRNIGKEAGLVVTVVNQLYRGDRRQQPVDEIRHEHDPHSPYHFPPT